MANETFLTAPAVQERYGVTKMTVWRWLNNDGMGFPRPARFTNRLYWKLSELEAWERSHIEGGADARAA